ADVERSVGAFARGPPSRAECNSRNGSSSGWLVGDGRCPVAASKTQPATVPGLSVPVMLATNTRPDCTDIVLPNGTFSVWARTGVDQSLSLPEIRTRSS